MTGKLWSVNLTYGAGGEATASDLQDLTTQVGATAIGNTASFALDANGDIYIINLTGGRISMIASATTNLSGHVTLGDFVGPVAGRQIRIEVRAPGTTTVLDSYTTTLDATGGFTVSTNRIGYYDVAIKSSHWLRAVVGNVAFGSGGANGLNVSLVNGDINGDNVVSLSDFSALRTAFNSSPSDPNWNPDADLNGDGVVSLADFSILRNNFNQQGGN